MLCGSAVRNWRVLTVENVGIDMNTEANTCVLGPVSSGGKAGRIEDVAGCLPF